MGPEERENPKAKLPIPHEEINEDMLTRYWQHPLLFVPPSIRKFISEYKFHIVTNWTAVHRYEQLSNKYVEAMFSFAKYIKEAQEEIKDVK